MTFVSRKFVLLVLGYIISVEGACPKDGTSSDGKGVELSGKRYPCIYLQQKFPDDNVAIYRDRVKHCQKTTDCCKTCADILSCTDKPNGIYLLGTYYDCKYLQKSYPEDLVVGLYKNRRTVCKYPTTNCCQTCRLVKEEAEVSTTQSPTTTKKSASKPKSTEAPLYKDTCTSDCLWIADGSYGTCGMLTDPSSDVYRMRHRLCSLGLTNGCRRSCYIVMKEFSARRQ